MVYLIILSSLIAFTFAKAASTPFTALDMHKLKRLSSTVVSPDGKTLVYSVRTWDSEKNKASTHLEYIDIESKQSGLLTDPALNTSDFNPAFSKGFDRTLIFLSARSSPVQAWTVNVPSTVTQDIPAATKLTSYPVDIISFKWSYDTGVSLVFNAEVYSSCGEDLDCTAKKDADIAARGPNTWATYDKLMIRHWDHWLTDKVSHLFVQKLTPHIVLNGINSSVEPILSGNPLELMLNMETNSPVGPFGGSEMYDVSPDGLEVAYSGADRTVDEAWNTGWKIYTSVVGDKSVAGTHLTTQIKARTTQPKYSKDGNQLGYLAMDRVGLESDRLHLEIYNRTSKIFTNITGSYDRSVNDYIWADPNTILFIATDLGNDKLFKAKLTSQNDGRNVLKLQVADFYSNGTPTNIPGTNKFVLERSSYQVPTDIWVLNFDNLEMVQLTNINSELAGFEMTPAESFYFSGGNGDAVQGFIFKPINFDGSKKYPLAYLIHGGPEGAWESSWSYRWNVQLWTNRGYAVVVVNPHGSTGMGQTFTDLVRNDWGGLPFKDLMNGVDYVNNTYKWVNVKKSCAVGASYGGYMVNWIQGQTDRFSCLVSHDGVFSTLTMFYATEELWFPMAEYCPLDQVGCKPYDSQKARDGYLKFSPEAYVQNWKTPQLVIHGSNDFRIPISEGISVFSALQVKGVPSRFLHMTEENHWVLNPVNSIKWYDEVLGWMDKYTAPTTPVPNGFLKVKK